MDNIPHYDLIQAIDPTKVKIPISDRFAKLTLSSNKKQQAKNEQHEDQQYVSTKEKRESLSGNFLKSLSLDNVGDRKSSQAERCSSKEEENCSTNNKSRQNPLLRSESSKDTDNNNSLTLEDDHETMEHLNVTEDDSETLLQFNEDLETLSQRIASMAVVSRPISISSASTDHLNEIIQLVSTESQRSSMNEINSLHIVKDIEINVAEALKQNTISLNSSASTHKNCEQPYEITDDEEDPITISDTSESHHENDPGEMITSSIQSTTQTSENLKLPCMQDDKAERVAAFLRDVSIERRVMEEIGHVAFHDTVDQILDNEAINKIQESLAKSRQIATADTESMTADLDEEVTPKSLTERENRMKALDDSIKHIDETEDNSEVAIQSQENSNKISQTREKNIRRLANDETLENTVISEDEKCGESNETPKIKSNLNSSNQYSFPNLLEESCKTTPDRLQKNGNDHRRLANDETKINSEISLTKINQLANDHDTQANNETEVSFEFPLRESNKTPKMHSNDNLTNCYNSPNRNRNAGIDPHKLANAETEVNSDFPSTESNKISKMQSNLNSSNGFNSANCQENTKSYHRRLANDETIANSITSVDEESSKTNKISEIHSNLNLSISNDYTKYLKTPERKFYKPANDETKFNSPPLSVASSPEVSSGSIHHQQSHNSIVNSSYEHNSPTPEDSITILETDEDASVDNNNQTPQSISETDDDNSLDHNKTSPQTNNSEDNKKLSNSFHNDEPSSSSSDDDGQMSQIQMSMASINISAKINIKIHIPQTTSTETSEDDNQNDDEEQPHQADEQRDEENESRSIESNQPSNQQSNKQFLKSCNQLQSKPPQQECFSPLETSSNSIEEVEDKKFLTEAEKLLTQLYGKSWQTPDVIKTLKRSSRSSDKKYNNIKSSSSKKLESVKSSKQDKSSNKSTVEESILDDFSMFRRNIVKTNLDSTRLVTPKTSKEQRFMKNMKISTEPRNLTKTTTQKSKESVIPQTERKPIQTPVAKVGINKRRADNNRWRQLLDNSDSEGNNASDDDDADQSWSKNASEIEKDCSDSEFENSPPTKTSKKNTKRRAPRRNNDNLTKQLNKTKEGDIVYLDLSKEEVEVQEDIPESPPANHDVTFASRLQDILKTCRHEDKAKLPSSQTKIKRKLFTPNFGDDGLEGRDLPKEDTQKIEAKLTNIDTGILEDFDNCPFDSQARPKILDLVNKQLELVKTGKPIFQLSPSPKKQTPPLTAKNDKNIEMNTPKIRKDERNKFKTPVTSKGPAKALHELYPTPEYKYSFLKSLDATVSKSFCHPDALYYRDNYRTKKEDLSKILYDMYNEKLFQYKIDVPIAWNKKLNNTAGRCLNKKKLGIRSSFIELSVKVLTSADRLRCTLLHELCHAATWIYNGEGGHGSTWKEWARRANAVFPEIPKIGVCHQYDIEYKYTYKCTLCSAKSHAHSKSKKVENIRCSYCHGAIEIFLNKKDKDGNIMPTPVKEPTGFAKFVKDNYKKFKRDDLKHADVMKLLSSEFATLKLTTNSN